MKPVAPNGCRVHEQADLLDDALLREQPEQQPPQEAAAPAVSVELADDGDPHESSL